MYFHAFRFRRWEYERNIQYAYTQGMLCLYFSFFQGLQNCFTIKHGTVFQAFVTNAVFQGGKGRKFNWVKYPLCWYHPRLLFVPPILPPRQPLCLHLTALITRGHGQLLMGHGCIAVILSLLLSMQVVPQPNPEKGHNPFRQRPPKSEGMKHMLPLINHYDQSHGCTANQWSERLWKSSCVPDLPSHGVVSTAKGNKQTSRNLEQRACRFPTVIKHTQVLQRYASRAKTGTL